MKKKSFDKDLIKRLWVYLSPYRWLIALAVCLLIVSKGIEASVPVYIGQVTDIVLGGQHELFSSVVNHTLTILGFLLLAYVLDSVNVVLKNWVGQRALFTLRSDVYRHIQQMPVEFYNNSQVGTLMTRTIHDVDQINQMFTESVVPLMGSLMLFISICVCLIVIDWRVALVLGGVLPIVFVLTNYFRKNQRRCYTNIRKIVATMNAFVQEHLLGASTIRSFGLQAQEREDFDAINTDHRDANIDTIHYFALFFAGIDFIQSLSLIAVFVVLVVLIPSDLGFQAGTFFTFSLYVLMLFRPLADVAERYNLLQSAIAAAERIFDVLDQEPENFDAREELPLNEIHSIAFEDVWFAYKDEEWVLKGLRCIINKGESVALVGVTGEGKTTILNLLLRFYENQRGSIKINGKEIQKYSLQQVREQFSVVLQDPELFSGSIRENICLDNPHITSSQLKAACEYVNLHPLLEQFSDGWEHQLFERGKSLSAGERQLVSMARAVAHHRSCIILDEATANIDSHTEAIIQKAMKKILHDKTAIVIAHRLSTIKDVDRIIVLHKGKVAESGSHQELLSAGGIYEKLYRLQFRNGA